MLAFERRALVTIFDTILPAGAHPKLPHGARDIPFSRFFDDAERDAPLDFLIGLRLSLWIIWLCPLFAIGRFRTFGGLDAGDRLKVLRWLQTRSVYLLREVPKLTKAVACLAYCGLPQIQAAIGIVRTDPKQPSWLKGLSGPAISSASSQSSSKPAIHNRGEKHS